MHSYPSVQTPKKHYSRFKAYHDTIHTVVVVRVDDGLLDAFTFIQRWIRGGADPLQDKIDTELNTLLLCELRIELAWRRRSGQDPDEFWWAGALTERRFDFVAEGFGDGVCLEQEALAVDTGCH